MSINNEQKLCDETVLVLQGGGSLGAYECGVYQALDQLGIKCNVIAGTSIGGVNAAVIAASKNDKAAKELENFWLTLAETITPPLLSDEVRAYFSTMYSAMWGNPNLFLPMWFKPTFNIFYNSPYLYDVTPLKKTLEDFVDFKKLKDSKKPRLILTSTDIQSGKPIIFDSKYNEIDADCVVAGAGYPFYGISWTQLRGRYLWDGTLLSNTPLREVIAASPTCDKKVVIVNLFPHNQEELPKNMSEAWHRARDIMHTDKTDHTVQMSRIISRYLRIIKEMHDIIESVSLDDKTRKKFGQIEPEYHKLACQRGAIIKEIIRIERKEDSPFLFEDADFSVDTIKQLIQNGKKDAKKILSDIHVK